MNALDTATSYVETWALALKLLQDHDIIHTNKNFILWRLINRILDVLAALLFNPLAPEFFF